MQKIPFLNDTGKKKEWGIAYENDEVPLAKRAKIIKERVLYIARRKTAK